MDSTTKYKTMKNRFNFTAKEKIAINRGLVARYPELMDALGIKYTRTSQECIHMACPMHEGADNPTGFSLTVDLDHRACGLWYCWTAKEDSECNNYKKDMIGLVSGVLEKHAGKKVPFPKVLKWCMDFLNCEDSSKLQSLVSKAEAHRQNLPEETTKKRKTLNYTRSEVRKALKRPAKYYLRRGYSAEILDKFDVGVCADRTKPMRSRVVVPVYDVDFKKVVGCVGRLQNEEYDAHNPKWKNSKGFSKSEYLYGDWIAKDHIRKTKTVVLVEGQGDVWRLHEAGIENAVGLFGSKLSDAQSRRIQTSGAFNIVVLTDNDDVGKKAKKEIVDKMSRSFNIITPTFATKDVGEMTVDEINKHLKPQLQGYI